MKIGINEKGQSLFELVVAIAISALVIAALVGLATNSIRNSSFSKNKASATNYSQEATEWLRKQRDSDVVAFRQKATVANYCLQRLELVQAANNPASECTEKILDAKGQDTPFSRWVSFSYVTPIIQATVVVTWTDSQGVHEVRSITKFRDEIE